jgi:hypothetical protein
LGYESESISFLPELLRTEFNWLFSSCSLKAGRMYYSAPVGFVAEGLFDGARFSANTGLGRFSVGAWYTGFLYKKRANIAMTERELESYHSELDFDNFADTYFAPRRLLAALDWEHPSLGGGFLRGHLSLLGQFDLSGKDEKVNTQYLTAKVSLPVNAFLFDLAGCFSLVDRSGDSDIAVAAEVGASWTLPTVFPSRLSVFGYYSSGVLKSGAISVFEPVTISSMGSILKANISGITMISFEYLARLHRTFSLSLSSSYFIRNDLGTFKSYPIIAATDGGSANGGYLLGNEIFGRLFWSPVSDISINLGGGLFMPSLGNAAPGANMLWRLDLGLVISIL